MRKLFLLVLFFFLFTLVAGIYGIIRSQINYSLCPEYYTKFKFLLYGLEYETYNSERQGAGLVGFASTWWVGFCIAFAVLPLSLMHKDPKQMVKFILFSMMIIIFLAFAGGWIGFFAGKFLPGLFSTDVPDTIRAKTNFTGVVLMNKFGMAGGVAGIIASYISLYIERKKSH